MSDSIPLLAKLAVIAFVVTNMLTMGLSLSVRQIHDTLKSWRLVLSVLVINFIAIPLLAFLISKLVPLEPSLVVAVLLLGTASGAPILPKLVEFAKGNLALAVGGMGLLMAVTIVYVPTVLPLLLPGSHANGWSIAKPLLAVTFPPLTVALAVRAYRPLLSTLLAPYMRLASNIALLAVVILAIALNYSNVIRIRNLEVIVAGAGLFLGAFGIGYIFGGPDPETRKVLGLSAAVRNASVAFLIAVENYPGTTVINYLVVLGIVAILIQLLLAFALGRRSNRSVARAG